MLNSFILSFLSGLLGSRNQKIKTRKENEKQMNTKKTKELQQKMAQNLVSQMLGKTRNGKRENEN